MLEDVGVVVAGVALWFGTVCWVVGIEAERCERRFRMIEQASSEAPTLGPGEGASVGVMPIRQTWLGALQESENAGSH